MTDGSGEEQDNIFDYIEQPSGKIGAKKMAKLEEKVRKRAEREVCKGLGSNVYVSILYIHLQWFLNCIFQLSITILITTAIIIERT